MKCGVVPSYLIFLFLLSTIPFFSPFIWVPQSVHDQRPLSLLQIEQLIRNRTPDNAIAVQIRKRGVEFQLNDRVLDRLQKEGAGPRTIHALKTVQGETDSMTTSNASKPKLWITYAWKNNAGGDFDFIVRELSKAGIDVIFDKIALVAGQRLWEQIAARIEDPQLHGWAILLTKESLESQACREELEYALDRALSAQRQDFPLIGLLHEVSVSELPAPLRVRLCVDLRSSDWAKEVRAALDHRPPRKTAEEATNLKGQVHNTYLGNPDLRAVEFAPRFGEIRYWRIAYPSAGPEPVMRGIGPTDGGGLTSVLEDFVEGSVDIKGVHMKFFGAGNALTASTAAYIVFEHEFPADLAFGYATKPFGHPESWQPIKIR